MQYPYSWLTRETWSHSQLGDTLKWSHIPFLPRLPTPSHYSSLHSLSDQSFAFINKMFLPPSHILFRCTTLFWVICIQESGTLYFFMFFFRDIAPWVLATPQVILRVRWSIPVVSTLVSAFHFLAWNREPELKPTNFSSLLFFRVFLPWYSALSAGWWGYSLINIYIYEGLCQRLALVFALTSRKPPFLLILLFLPHTIL